MKSYIIAHDMGTSCDKAALITAEGQILRTYTIAYPVDKRITGQAEQNPLLWWDAFCGCNQALLQGFDPQEVAGVSLCSQMMCCLPVDHAGKVLHPAIIWADNRACLEAEQLENRVGADRFYQIVGMRAAANYSLPKMMWLKKHLPDIYKNTYRFLNAKDYINYRLTGRMATDPETAAYMHCLDRRSNDWSAELLDAGGIDAQKLPTLVQTGSVLGAVISTASGLAAGTPVIMGMGDGGAATLGTGTIEAGEAYTSLGTSSWVCAVTECNEMDAKRSISKLNYLKKQRASGTMQAGGYSYSWLRDTFCRQECEQACQTGQNEYTLIDRLAQQATAGAGGVLFQPYLMGERAPYWDAKLRGAFLGITAQTGRAELCRSVLEGVAMHLGLILARIRQVNGMNSIRSMKLVGGGANSPLWRQIFADVYGLPIMTMDKADHAGTLGVAVIAGVAVGLYPDIRVVRDFQHVTSVTEPNAERQAYYKRLSELFSEAHDALLHINHDLSNLDCDQ